MKANTPPELELTGNVILRYPEGSGRELHSRSFQADPSVATRLHQDDAAAVTRWLRKMQRALACLLVLVISFAASAQPLADRIPQDAVIYIGWSGSESMGAAYDQSHLKAVVEASNVRELLNESLPRLLENI